MKWLSKIFTSNIPAIIDSLKELIDKNITNKQEKEKLKVQLEQELTLRLIQDTQSDSWLSKNVRPLTLLIIILTLAIVLFFKLEVDATIVELFKKWGGLAIAFYFGFRGIEKIVRNRK